jgi:hypothetical protein
MGSLVGLAFVILVGAFKSSGFAFEIVQSIKVPAGNVEHMNTNADRLTNEAFVLFVLAALLDYGPKAILFGAFAALSCQLGYEQWQATKRRVVPHITSANRGV